MNDRGQVVGYDRRDHGGGPALLWEDGAFTELGTGSAHDINNRGQIVLRETGTDPGGRPVRLDPDGTRTPVSVLPWGDDFRNQYSINDNGQIVGKAQNFPVPPQGRPFFWNGATVTYIEFDPPADNASAQAVNDAGQVVGWRSGRNASPGYLWHNGTVTDLPSPGLDINERGQVLLEDGVWDNGQVTPIPPLPPLPVSDPAVESLVQAREINDRGQVTGWVQEMYLLNEEDGHSIINRAFVWDPVNGTRDLNALMGFQPDASNQFPLALALDINNAGQIVGDGPNGAWLLTPVPEPASVAGVLAPLALFAARRRRPPRQSPGH